MVKFTDTIDKRWLEHTNELADKLEQTGDVTLLSEFTIDQLTYLAYWNWGYSGAYKAPETKLAEEELVVRGSPFDLARGEAINEAAEMVVL